VVGLSRHNLQQLDLQQQQQPTHFQQSYPAHHFHQPQIGSVPVVPHAIINGDLSLNILQTPAVGSAVTQLVPTSPTGPPPAFPLPIVSSASTTTTTPVSSAAVVAATTATTPTTTTTQIPTRTIHNDLNDAQNISKILQSSIHNGSSSTINSTSNHSSEKRLFIAEDSPPPVNHKEERQNNNASSNDKNHHRSKRKQTKSSQNQQQQQSSPPQKQPSPTPLSTTNTSPTTPTKKQQQQQQQNEKHVHTNGLIDKKSKCQRKLVNGDEAIEEDVLDKFKEENMNTRSLAFREIRKMGRDYSGLYEQLENIKGTFEMRFGFVQMCIDEASRFRRKHMADCIQEWWASRCDEAIVDQTGKKKKT
jgi:hypothetical protein